jgi:hypothetical protein
MPLPTFLIPVEGGCMKRYALLIALCLASALAHAKGVPFAVDSFQKAQSIAKQDKGRHVLVFYTHEL